MQVLLDTNVVVASVNESDASHAVVASTLRSLARNGDVSCITPQVIFEFWVVATRPTTSNGLGLSLARTMNHIDRMRSAYSLLAEPADLLDRWIELCEAYSVLGRKAHDARLVAVMLAHQITKIITINVSDFRQFREIECVKPA